MIPALLVMLAHCFAPQESPTLAPGQEAPALEVATWLDGRAALELGHGRACVLVFWAPWCGSCVSEFPRLNGLVKELAGEPVDFVSITDEPRDKVEALLAARPLSTRVALDREGRTFERYGVHVLPRVVLVDASGGVAALPRMEDVDADVLRALAAGEELALPVARAQPADLEWDEGKGTLDASTSLGHVWIERSGAASGGVRFPPDHGRITADGVGFANLVQVAYGAEPHQVQSTHPEYERFEQVYRLSVKAPDDRPETARAMLREALARLFSFHAEWVEVVEPTPVLRRVPGKELHALAPSRATNSGGMARNGSIHFVKVPFERIVAVLGPYGLGRGMVDETGLAGDYDIDLEWTPGSVSGFRKALGDCGLALVDEPRSVRKLRLDP